MKQIAISLFLLIVGYIHAFAQETGTVKGRVTDTVYVETMADATVSVLHASDSSVIGQTRADEKGAFIIKNLKNGTYRLSISFQGYETVNKTFSLSANNPVADMGVINMSKASDMLDEIIVERPPITIKGDTVEFSAGAFKTKPNAVAEDLLKKLPGVEVDKDGNITAQGEAVPKIYVNGKEFFGNDPKMATKNITADMIESVQVFDDMSEQAKFTRIDDGSRTKTINIKLKRGMDKGYFGRGNISYGTDDLYSGTVMMNRFQGDNKLSVVASSNNINKQGFNPRDIVGNMGGFGGGGGGGRRGGGGGSGSGINRASNIGLNYSNNFGKLSLTTSYMYGNTTNKTYQTSNSEYRIRNEKFGLDSTSFERDTSSSFNETINHNFNLKLEYEIDSMNSIVYTPNFTIQNSHDNRIGNRIIRSVNDAVGLDYTSITGITQQQNKRSGLNLNNELLFRHRFKKFGRTFTLGYKNAVNNSDGDGKTFSPLTYYDPTGSVDSVLQRDFLSWQHTRSNNNVISTSYTEPIGTNKVLEANYAYTNNLSTSEREAYSYRADSKDYDSLNAQQTNNFRNVFIAHRLGLNFRYKGKAYGFQLGGSMQASRLDNNGVQALSADRDSAFVTKQDYINFFPTANFKYDFSKRKNLELKYQGRTNQPSVRQLQSVRDETNALRTSVGNPNLKQEFTNRLNLSYKTFNETNFRYFNFGLNIEQTSNKIVNSIDADTLRGTGVQLTRPINLNGAYNASYDMSFSIPFKEKKGSSFNMGNRMGYNQSVGRQFGQNNYTNTFTLSQSAGLNLDIKEKLNMEFRGRFSYNSVNYRAQDKGVVANQSNRNNQNTRYYAQNYSTEINYFIIPSLILSTDFDYTINSGLASGFNTSIPLWNSSLAYQLFKKKNGEIKLSINDILNQNSNISRRVTDNLIEDTRTVILQRYALLTFTYSFNRFGGKRGERSEFGEFRRGGGNGGDRMQRGGGGSNDRRGNNDF